jgi:hypothetical protein
MRLDLSFLFINNTYKIIKTQQLASVGNYNLSNFTFSVQPAAYLNKKNKNFFFFHLAQKLYIL